MDLIDLIWLIIKEFLKELLKKWLSKKTSYILTKKEIEKFKSKILKLRNKIKIPSAQHLIQKALNKITDTAKFLEHHKDIKEKLNNSWFQTKPEIIELSIKQNPKLLDKAVTKLKDVKSTIEDIKKKTNLNDVDLIHIVKEVKKRIQDLDVSLKEPKASENKATELTNDLTHNNIQKGINEVFNDLPKQVKKNVYSELDIKPNKWIAVSSTWIKAMRFFIPEEDLEEADTGRIDYLTKHITRSGNNYYQGTFQHDYFDFCSAVSVRMVPKGKTKWKHTPNKNGYYPYWNNGAGNVIWRLFGANKHPMM